MSEPSDAPQQPNKPQSRPPIDPGGVTTPPPPPPGYAPMPYPVQPSRGGGVVTRIVTSLVATLLLVSIVLNIYFGVIFVSMARGPVESVYQEGDLSHRIAIMPIDGLIDDSTAVFARETFEEIRRNPPQALILRVNSGGGYVGPSDRIWHLLVQLRRELKEEGVEMPVVASFGNTAASGAYYISAPVDKIFAEPTTITGSIGVIAQAFTVHELLDKIGVTPEVIASTQSTRKDLLNPMRPWTPEDRTKLRSILDVSYERFVQVVLQGRAPVVNMTEEEARQVATGEFFTAAEAIQLKLVDEEGYLSDAIEECRRLANMPADANPHVTTYEVRGSGLLGIFSRGSKPGFSLDQLDVEAEQAHKWVLEMSAPRLMYHAGMN